MNRLKTKRIVKSIKQFNKQARVLQRGVLRRDNTARYKEQERPPSSSEQIQERNEANLQRAIGSSMRVTMVAATTVRKRWLHSDQVYHSYREADRDSRASMPIRLMRGPVNGEQPRIARRKSPFFSGIAVVQHLPERQPAEKKKVGYTPASIKADHNIKGRGCAPRRKMAAAAASPFAGKMKQKGTIRQRKALNMVARTIKSAHHTAVEAGHARKEDKQVAQQKRMLQTAIQARYSIKAARAVTQMNIRMMKILVRATVLLVKGVAALLGVSSSVIILLCIIMIIAALLSSPFAIFVADENTEPGTQKLTLIVEELDEHFKARLLQERQAAGDVDRVEIHYAGSADNSRIDNWPEVLAVFAVKTSMSTAGFDVATMDSRRVEMLQTVYWDMNQLDSYVETLEHTEMVGIEQEDGSIDEQQVTEFERVLYLSITARTAEQQAALYDFNTEQTDIMNELLSAAFRPMMLALLGIDKHTGVSSGELEAIRTDLPAGVIGSQAVELALTRLGDPYSQLKAGQGNYTDCSYLIQWVYKQLEVGLPRTAAEQARFIVDNGLTLTADELRAGDLIFWSYEQNGRFMDITHVGIYAGNGKVVDASSSRLQVVYRNLFDVELQVMYGRPYFQG
ncbi:C40 family peptidase [Paenibacillus brevis]|uniref:C40 family peptidase n=1 Tax=Paenibacillus brevis TaxID=2841508 RepID=A0ABS6FSM1_9BACL|nr:C40 family peptidase [Paenibacillus brevis]